MTITICIDIPEDNGKVWFEQEKLENDEFDPQLATSLLCLSLPATSLQSENISSAKSYHFSNIFQFIHNQLKKHQQNYQSELFLLIQSAINVAGKGKWNRITVKCCGRAKAIHANLIYFDHLKQWLLKNRQKTKKNLKFFHVGQSIHAIFLWQFVF